MARRRARGRARGRERRRVKKIESYFSMDNIFEVPLALGIKVGLWYNLHI